MHHSRWPIPCTYCPGRMLRSGHWRIRPKVPCLLPAFAPLAWMTSRPTLIAAARKTSPVLALPSPIVLMSRLPRLPLGAMPTSAGINHRRQPETGETAADCIGNQLCKPRRHSGGIQCRQVAAVERQTIDVYRSRMQQPRFGDNGRKTLATGLRTN